MGANDKQVGGDHYGHRKTQHWDWAQHIPYLEGCATKYLGRHGSKNGLEDVKKALHFVEKIVERDYPEVLFNWDVLPSTEAPQQTGKAPTPAADQAARQAHLDEAHRRQIVNMGNPYVNVERDMLLRDYEDRIRRVRAFLQQLRRTEDRERHEDYLREIERLLQTRS